MIKKEDDSPLKKREALIIPYTAIVTKNGDILQTAYPDVLPLLTEWDQKYATDPLSCHALKKLEAILAPFLAQNGYEREECDIGKIYVTLECTTPLAQGDFESIRLQGNEWFAYENTTDFYPDYTDQIAYVTLHEGKIVSVAAENPNGNDTLAELYLETHLDFQGKGLAQQNAVALICELQKAGKQILYRCEADHAASLHIAKKLHFTEIDRFYCHNAYQIEG